jgi:hypothetical protein
LCDIGKCKSREIFSAKFLTRSPDLVGGTYSTRSNVSRDADVRFMFARENASRMRYSEKIRNKEDLREDFYKEADKNPETNKA